MTFDQCEQIRLDFTRTAMGDLTGQLSGAARAPDGNLWTVSDEGRTVECLVPFAGGYRLSTQINVPKLVTDIAPGTDELDLEAIAIEDQHLWIAGSHCFVREKPDALSLLEPGVRDRPSRHVLARFRLGDDGQSLKRPRWLPPLGASSLRSALKGDPYLDRFLAIPSKENGLDIEGLAALGKDRVLLGLRGPVLDGRAVVLAVELAEDGEQHFRVKGYERHFLDLGGLGVRDLCLHGDEILVLAGPVADAGTPFRLYRWRPGPLDTVVTPELISIVPSVEEKPEGLCLFRVNGREGLLVVYDSAKPERVWGNAYLADWVPMPVA